MRKALQQCNAVVAIAGDDPGREPFAATNAVRRLESLGIRIGVCMQCKDCAIPRCKPTLLLSPYVLSKRILSLDPTTSILRLCVAVEGEPRELHPIIRDDMYKLSAEGLRNAFRHAHSNYVKVEIHYDKERFRLLIRDDGRGIDPAALATDGREGHYGVPSMRERVQVIGEKLEIRTSSMPAQSWR